MKKIITIALVMLSLYSCSKEEKVMDLKGETLSYDQFFDKVVASKADKNQVVYFDYTWDKKTNLITVIDITKAEPNFFILEKNLGAKSIGKEYTVECSKGGKTTSVTCDGKFSCGSAIYDCLEKGGCATICTNHLVYLPITQTFILDEEIRTPHYK